MAESIPLIAVKLGKLILKEAHSLQKVKKEVESLEKKLKDIGSDLKKADVMTDREEEFDNWVGQLRELAFKVEDVIEVFLNNATPYDDGCAGVIRLILGCLCQIATLCKLKKEIRGINIELNNLPDKNSLIKSSPPEVGDQADHDGLEEDQLVSRRSNEDDDDLIGFRTEADNLASKLTEEEPQGQLVVISIWGQAGAGKTALARHIYRRIDGNHEFDCVAWVSVSPEYQKREIWVAILGQVNKKLTEEEKEGFLQTKGGAALQDKLYDSLKEKNYLIVLDDLWKQSDWEILSQAFPKSPQKKCRVLLTTRNDEVARAANPSSDPHKLRDLDKKESLELFLRKVYGCSLDRMPAETSPSPQMKDVASQLVSKCGGLPIAIVLLGGVLSGKKKEIVEWTDMLEKVHSDLIELSALRKVFAISYNKLPYILKSCFLYLGLFPEDSEIDCDKLIRLWAAEGFLEQHQKCREGDDETTTISIEDVGRDCLKGLIQRSMIQVVECKTNGDPRTCRTHDLVRSLAIREAKKAKFSVISRRKQLGLVVRGYRRIAIHPADDQFHLGTSSSSFSSSSSVQDSVDVDVDVVGFEREGNHLASLLTMEEPLGQLAAFSIVGIVGTGKTTLAEKVYNRIDVKSQFGCRVWVNVSVNYEVLDILKGILQQVRTLTDADQSKLEEKEEEELRRMLHYHLEKQSSYLIVLDEVLRDEQWDVIESTVFPKPVKGQKCRVLLTTRSDHVARYVKSTNTVHLRHLDEEESLKLFLQTSFKCSQDEIPEKVGLSQEMEEIAYKFALECRGHPLMIVLLGGLLSVKRKDVTVWANILASLTNLRPQVYIRLLDLISMCYEDLPDYLRYCFISFRHFPENTEIKCNKLIQSWDANGFLKEDVARDCLEELIQRKMIKLTKRRSDGTPETCRIHEALRDLALGVAGKEEFSTSFKNKQLGLAAEDNRGPQVPEGSDELHGGKSIDSPTHTFQHPKTFSVMDNLLCFLDPFKFPNHVYSLTCFFKNPQILCFEQFHLLRVLDLEGVEKMEQVPNEIRNLILLKYLSLRGTCVKQIPTWIANLSNLQTLDAPGSKIPSHIYKLNLLRHLFAHSFSSSPPSLSAFKHLHTVELDLGNWVTSGLQELTNLRVLRLHGADDTVLKAIADLKRLRFLFLTKAKASLSTPMHLPLSSHIHLNEMVVEGAVTKATIDFPPHLTYLWLENSLGYRVDPFLQLQKLHFLKKLCLRLFKGISYVDRMTCPKGGFPKLEYLYIRVDFELKSWIVEEGALPSLGVLHIEGDEKLGKLPDGLKYIKTLKQLIITRGYDVRDSLKYRGEEWKKIEHIRPSIKYLDESSIKP